MFITGGNAFILQIRLISADLRQIVALQKSVFLQKKKLFDKVHFGTTKIVFH